MMSQTSDVVGPSTDPIVGGVVKGSLVWIGVGFSKMGINTWSDVAAVLASIYTTFLIVEWLWKKYKLLRGLKP